jgi:hypothetical protein
MTCAEGKQTKNNQSKKDTGANSPIDRVGGVICSDLKGPITPVDREKNRYLVNFVDHKTNYCRIFLAKTKDEGAKKFLNFVGHFERRFDCRIQVLRTDGGGEYVNVDLFCAKNGIARQRTEADNPASNGKAERMHRTILNMARCMIFNSRLPMHFWGDAVQYAAYVLNRSPCKSNPQRKSPIEMLEGKPPNLTHVVTFGSPCMVYRKPGKNSLKKRSQRAVILGISEEVKGYRVYLMDDKKVVVTQHVKYIETLSRAQNFSLLTPTATSIDPLSSTGSATSPADSHPVGGASEPSTPPAAIEQSTPPVEEAAEPLVRMSTRAVDKRKPSRRIRDILSSFITTLEDEDEEEETSCNAIDTSLDPPNYTAAMKTPAADQWNIAIDNELKSLRDNRTWIVVNKPANVKPLQSRFVFKLKLDADGAIERYKARLVARGDQQIEGVNYQDTFSPVMDMTTARIIFALGILWGNPPRHGDIPVAYTRASPEENLEIYMHPPQGMKFTAEESASGGNKPVLKLMKNIYGLKQAGRLWHPMLSAKLLELQYKQSSVDMCLYFKVNNTTNILVGVYVDDLLVTSNDAALIEEFFVQMKAFDVKDLGIAAKFLGIKVEFETPDGYTMSQQTMILALIEQFGMKHSKPVGTPIAEVIPSVEDQNLLQPAEASSYRTLAGALLWIARCTRPDISFAVHQMTRRTHAPRMSDFKIGKRILRYLAGTTDHRLTVAKMSNSTTVFFEVFTDADWASEATDRKSVNASLVYLNGMLVSWHCNKQALVSLSTMESEFVSAAHGIQEAMGCYHLIKELKRPMKLPMQLRMDNQAAIASIMNEASSSKTKHVDIKHKFIKDLYQHKLIMPSYVSTIDMKADILTKIMPGPTFVRLRNLIGIHPPEYHEGKIRGGVLDKAS